MTDMKRIAEIGAAMPESAGEAIGYLAGLTADDDHTMYRIVNGIKATGNIAGTRWMLRTLYLRLDKWLT